MGRPGPALKSRSTLRLWKGLGLAFELDRITVQPNTIDAHRLSGCAQRQGWQDEMVEVLFRAYFMEGIDLNDHDALAGLAATVGFDWGQVAVYLGSATDVRTVKRLQLEARVAGIDIVPFFIFNGKVTVSGAHEVKVLLEAMARATRPKRVGCRMTAWFIVLTKTGSIASLVQAALNEWHIPFTTRPRSAGGCPAPAVNDSMPGVGIAEFYLKLDCVFDCGFAMHCYEEVAQGCRRQRQ